MTDILQLIAVIMLGSTVVFGTTAIWILMGYYSIKILRSFKGGVLVKGWKYICIAVPFLIFGQLATGMGGSSSLILQSQQILKVVGASLSLIGGLMIVIGFRTEYKAWNPKQMKMEASVEKSAPQQAIA